jgi:hypothetical protein
MRIVVLIFFLFIHSTQAKAHAGGFVERCDYLPLPTCTFDWNAITNTDSALYVVGNSGYCVIYYHKGGIKTINVGISDALTGVQFVNASVGYIWGKNGKMLKTTNGGINWIQITTGVSDNIDKAQFISETHAFFIEGSTIHKTTNGGTSWAPITLPAGISFKDFHFFDAQNGQICGNTTSPSINGYLYQTNDGGDNWNLLYTNTTAAFAKLFYNDGNGYLYGTTAGDPIMYSTNNNGSSWNSLYTSSGWKLNSDVISYQNQPVFITNEAGGDYLYNCPYFLDPYYGILYNPKNIYSTTINGMEALYIIESSGVYRYTSGELTCMQFNFVSDINPNPDNRYNTFAPNKKVRFKALLTNASDDNISSIRGILKCRSPYIKVTDSIAMYYDIEENLTYYNSAWSDDEYEIEINDNVPLNYIAHFEFIYDNSVPVGPSHKSAFSMPIIFSPFTLFSKNVVDTATANTSGNGNGIIEISETAQMTLIIKNISAHYLYDISARLYSEFDDIHIWNNHARPDGGGVVFNEYTLGSFDPNQIRIPVGNYVFTNNFEENYDIPFILGLKGSLSEFMDPSGCSFSYFYNILYQWELNFNVNSSFGPPPDSLRSNFVPYTPPIKTVVLPNKTEQTWNVFPNPCDGKLTIVNSSGVNNLSLTNMLGQEVTFSEQKQENHSVSIDFSAQPPGIYFLTVENKTTKVIKK